MIREILLCALITDSSNNNKLASDQLHFLFDDKTNLPHQADSILEYLLAIAFFPLQHDSIHSRLSKPSFWPVRV
jgi:hypothetical protein